MSAELQLALVPAAQIIDLRWQVLRAGRPRHTAHLPGDDSPTTVHAAAILAGDVIGCLTRMQAVIPGAEEPAWRLRGMAVATAHHGRGVGSRLLTWFQDAHPESMWCDARLRAVPFYERHGWRCVSDVYDVPEVGPHKRMVWTP